MFNALQDIELTVDGRTLKLVRGERVQLSEMEGTVLIAGGYVERADDGPSDGEAGPLGAEYDQGPAAQVRGRESYDSGDSRVQRPAQG